ncbi:MAG: phosphoribosylglycinamide formyltransferase [Bacteroidetes bacterium GWD2_45_23]|nr:MAG: phosphoribosylglycinamide formyltransferase [Bacteroidetes bacterium GWC2_46_850]OFX78992.1 MAG: phosphoribosylglycinamide formyltransferase [Bacteroidetes bacterium GWC1_47_7]OFX82967.1 MAG: phosphoribosylglycinamide formyltransferase [Bacteroidetes bacterium GWD2_45_23]HAR39088.1 phosphoribosylglycinamide formyltransferase [Porphyromonadaceae bacterium]HBA99890.1 phosphoribosylglycinamide formyltransferase [Porphyromonadaceae bacterium]
MTQIAIFASGSGSNAENIADYFKGNPDIGVALILSNKQDAYVHERAKKLGIASFFFTKVEFDEGTKILDVLRKNKIDFIVLAGFLLKISQPILDAFSGRIINIHPALLPKYGGKGMYGDKVHQAVIDAGETESGITIHYVNEHYDAGHIIYQVSCEVQSGDSCDILAARVHALEYAHFPRVIEDVVRELYMRGDIPSNEKGRIG